MRSLQNNRTFGNKSFHIIVLRSDGFARTLSLAAFIKSEEKKFIFMDYSSDFTGGLGASTYVAALLGSSANVFMKLDMKFSRNK